MRHVLGNWVLRACFCLGLVFGPTAWAHKSSDSYLRLSVGETGVTGEWYLALHDLEFAIGIDVNEDGDITWGELKQRKGAVLEYARSRLGLESDAAVLEPKFEEELRVDQLANGGYVVLRCRASWPKEGSGRSLRVENRVFFDGDPLHRGMLVLDQGEGKPVHEGIFHPQETRLSFDLERPEPGRAFVGYLTEGVRHIGLGYDHVLFLLVLLLPSVLTRERDRWVPRDEFRGAFWSVVRIVTAFTIAHSVTLTAAALDWVRLPSRFVESTIAASIVVAALNNLAPR
ncbi:MAG: HupE/UreJ family protein, partial [Verrucomicrobiales bacterium]|nr:HupE/UreJ family protein [Verrucomicrobiales bacterium]